MYAPTPRSTRFGIPAWDVPRETRHVAGAIRSISPPARAKLTDRLSARGDVGKNFAVITVGIMLGNAVAVTALVAVGITAAVLVTYLDPESIALATADD